MPKEHRVSLNIWAMTSKVLIHAIDKGQLPGACLALVLVVLSARCPADQIPVLYHCVAHSLKSYAGVSYMLNVALLAGSAYGFRRLRVQMSSELDRVGREKTSLQEALAARKLSSSSKKNKS
jgi:hypothetical protein